MQGSIHVLRGRGGSFSQDSPQKLVTDCDSKEVLVWISDLHYLKVRQFPGGCILPQIHYTMCTSCSKLTIISKVFLPCYVEARQ